MWKSNIPLSQISAADEEKMKELRKEIGIDGRSLRYRAFCLPVSIRVVVSFARFIKLFTYFNVLS